MNYYIQGNKEKADQIKTAFEQLGYDISWPEGCANPDVINIGVERNGAKYVVAETAAYIRDIIKTHPDYKELELPVEPKFKVGDWITNGTCKVKITDINNTYYWFSKTCILGEIESIENEYHLWSIQDAKDGDVITNGKLIVIFNKLEEPVYRQHIIAYVGLDLCGRLQITEDIWRLGVDKAMPATKEQRDLLFKKMKEAGYQWDADKKELRKIQPHYDIDNFKVGMPVLVRDSNKHKWMYVVFSHNEDKSSWGYKFNAAGTIWEQCIPFNDDTKHLLGTTRMPSEEYINW